ncbi:MAG TPA: lactonase family protein [Flavobacteriaceae bacterium]|nr:lactonase family protein [Flavobacteriaceae bacterium]
MKLKLYVLWLVLSLVSCTAEKIPLYVGTYTSGDSEGIYRFQFNSETGELSDMQLAVKTENPSFLAYAPGQKHLYAVNENDNGTVSSFEIEDNDTLTLMNMVSSNGSAPCHIAINRTGNIAAVSNYGSGTLSLYTISNDGSLNDAFQVFDHNTENETSHVHSAQFFNEDLYVSDLGRNSVYDYRTTKHKTDYELINPSIVAIPDNSGPRHFALTKDGQFIYIINELGNTITSAKKVNGKFQLIENVPTIDDTFKGESFCADIHLSKNEAFLYGSNRGENSIVVFARDTTTGKLKKIQSIGTDGDWPRNFTLDPSGKFLLVANKKSNNIAVFKINNSTGKLSFIHSTGLPSPVCLLFYNP